MNNTLLNNLLQGIQFRDPRLYDLLRLMVSDIQDLNDEVFEPVAIQTERPAETVTPPDVTSFNWSYTETSLILQAAVDSNVPYSYEIRKGTDWNTADRVVVSGSGFVVLDPIAVGSHTYLAKAISSDGTLSVNAKALVVTIPPIGETTITTQIIDNNVLLYWTAPTSTWRISHYDVLKDGVSQGIVYATFKTIFEALAGTYEYTIVPYDIAGNVGSGSSIQVTLSQPPDYELLDIFESALDGTKVDTTLDVNKLLCNFPQAETWTDHFTSHSWNTPQDQVTAGYPYYLQPTKDVGSYEEVIDYGTSVGPAIVNVTYNYNILAGTGHTIVVTMSTSVDNITYSTPANGSSQFMGTAFRYLKLKLTLTALN